MELTFPKTLLQFEHRFRTDQACRVYLARVRWPDGVQCPGCDFRQAWWTRRGVLRCGKCLADFSVTAGTVFQDSKLPLRVWFRAIWWITNQKSGISALGLQRTLGLGSYETAWALLHKLRRAMVRPGREPLSGKVEVDETIVGGRRKVENGRRLRRDFGKALVVVAAEVRGKKIGRIRLQRVSEPSKGQLQGFIKNAVAPGSTVITDGWGAYYGLAQKGFRHRPIVTPPKNQQADFILPRVHRVAALLKRWLLGIHQGRVSVEHLDFYLDEFTFRFNRRASPSRGQLFSRLLEQAVVAKPAPYRKLEKANR